MYCIFLPQAPKPDYSADVMCVRCRGTKLIQAIKHIIIVFFNWHVHVNARATVEVCTPKLMAVMTKVWIIMCWVLRLRWPTWVTGSSLEPRNFHFVHTTSISSLRVRSFILHENRWTQRIQVEAFAYAPPKMVDYTVQFTSSFSVESSGV